MSLPLTPLALGRWAVVTGGSSGIGLAHAHELASRGFDLLLAGRDTGRLDGARAALVDEHGITVETASIDLAAWDGGERVVAAVAGREVGALVLVAGEGTPGEFVDTALDDYLDCVTLKVRSNLVVLHSLARAMTAREAGAIVITSSTGALQGVPGLSTNAGAEAYLLSVAEALHRELAPRGVRVLGLMPGVTATPGMQRMLGGRAMPRSAQAPGQVAAESLRALEAGRATHISGAANRVLLSVLPRRARTRFFARMIGGLTAPIGTSA